MRLKAGEIGSYDAKIYLDGDQRTHVIEADEEGRFIVRYRTDEQGRFIKSEDGSTVLTEKMRGDVAIVLADQWAWVRNWKGNGEAGL